MAKTDITFRIKIAWWVKYYLYMLAFFCHIYRAEPDKEKLGKMIGKAWENDRKRCEG